MVILVINHIHLESPLEGTPRGEYLSAAEVLVSVSGVVVGMVFGRRWVDARAARATTWAMLRLPGRTEHVASLVVVAAVGAARPGSRPRQRVLTVSPRLPRDQNLYAFGGPLETGVARDAPGRAWQFNILGFFVAALAHTPSVLWALARGGGRR